MYVAPSANCPSVPPTASFVTPPLPRIPPLRARALQFVHERAVCYEEGITFYALVSIPHQETVSALLPTRNEIDQYTARVEVIQALSGLEKRGFVAGTIPSGYSTLRVTLKGACWILLMQPLLKLSERAEQLEECLEAVEALKCLIEANGETQSKAVPILYIAIEKLENAVGGEKDLINYLGRSRVYISDLKQSLQHHRHAVSQAQIKLSYQQCLARAAEIIEGYVVKREQEKAKVGS